MGQGTRAGLPPAADVLLALLAGEATDRPVSDLGRAGFGSSDDGEITLPAAGIAHLAGVVPFSGSIAASRLPAPLRAQRHSRRAPAVALAWSLAALRDGGRAALIVPASLLHGASKSELALRQALVRENSLRAVIALGPGVVRARTRAAIVAFDRGGYAAAVWMHSVDTAAGLRELAAHWTAAAAAFPPQATGTSVARDAIEAAGFDLRPDRYPPVTPAPPTPHAILHEIATLEAEILQGIRNLVGLLK